MTPTLANLARVERELDTALRRGDDLRAHALRLERADLRLMLAIDGIATGMRVAS